MIIKDNQLHLITLFFYLQENFPVLEKKPYPSWIYVIIFLLAGIPSLAVPGTALFRAIRNYCCKKHHTDAVQELNSISYKIQMHDEEKKSQNPYKS